MKVEDLILTGLIMLMGEQGIDWRFYVSCPTYWHKWAELNRN